MTLYIDGGCSGNGQTDLSKRKMLSVVTDEMGNVLVEKEEHGGSNNIAELIALKEALIWCCDNNVFKVSIKTDSKNTIAWAFGKKVGKKINDRGLVLRIKDFINQLLPHIKFTLDWLPRENNVAGHYIESKYGL